MTDRPAQLCSCDRRLVLGGLLGVPAVPARASDVYRIGRGACLLDAVTIADRVVPAFPPSPAARLIVGQICEAVGLPANFQIVAVDDRGVNALAAMLGPERYIVYNRGFLTGASASAGLRDWDALAVMAHEIGHHLCGHPLDSGGSRPPRELEADHFAGFVLATLGATEAQATHVFRGLSGGNATHPPSTQRVQVASAGWRKGAGLQAGEERHNVITHNANNSGGYDRVVVEFAGRDGAWQEYQFGRLFTAFDEVSRTKSTIYLYDVGRKMWVRLDHGGGGRTAIGYWYPGDRSRLPTSWRPLDPLAWR